MASSVKSVFLKSLLLLQSEILKEVPVINKFVPKPLSYVSGSEDEGEMSDVSLSEDDSRSSSSDEDEQPSPVSSPVNNTGIPLGLELNSRFKAKFAPTLEQLIVSKYFYLFIYLFIYTTTTDQILIEICRRPTPSQLHSALLILLLKSCCPGFHFLKLVPTDIGAVAEAFASRLRRLVDYFRSSKNSSPAEQLKQFKGSLFLFLFLLSI